MKTPMLLTKELKDKLPAPYSTDGQKDAMALAKWFTPDGQWTWYVIEYDRDNEQVFCLVDGFECELGWVSVEEVAAARGPLSLGPLRRGEEQQILDSPATHPRDA